MTQPTGVFVRLHDGELSTQQISDLKDQSMTSLESVIGGELDASRECFKRFYAQMCTEATGCAGVTPDYVRGLRSGDGYGSRPFLNNLWEAWPNFSALALAKLSEKDAEILRLRAGLERIEQQANEYPGDDAAALGWIVSECDALKGPES